MIVSGGWSRWVGRVVGPLVVVVGVLGLPSCVLAAGAPEWSQEKVAPPSLVVHSTRVIMRTELRSEGLVTKWRSDYAQAECGSISATEWLPVNEGEVPAAPLTSTLSLGAADPGEEVGAPVLLRHLSPGTRYCVRFEADNAAGSAKEEIPFETRPVEVPEVPHFGIIEQLFPFFNVDEITNTSLGFSAQIESDGSNSEYTFEYSLPEGGHAPGQNSPSWKPVTSEATGEVTVAEDFLKVKAKLMGLSAETTYYIRIKLHNSAGTGYQTLDSNEEESVETGTSTPGSGVSVRNVTGGSAHFSGVVVPHSSATGWVFEYVAAGTGGSCPSVGWVRPSGGEGTVGQAQAEATPYSDSVSVGVSVGGLGGSRGYCVRLSVTNKFGSGVSSEELFETEGPPTDNTFVVHRVVGGALELLGTVNPKSVATSEEQVIGVEGATGGSFTLTFGGQTTVPIAYDASGGEVEDALRGLSSGPPVQVEGVDGGPYTVFFGEGDTGTAQPLIEANAAGLTSSSSASVKVSRVQSGGVSNAAEFWFQYVTDTTFSEKGWSTPEETGHENAGLGESPHLVGLVVPGLKAGEGYHFRIVAKSALSVSPAVGNEETLTVPLVSGTAAGGCSNQAFRTGLSAVLPDCRVFEQVTPVEKGAAQEPFHYRGGIQSAVLVGEDGEHAVLEAPEVSYGSGTSSGQSPYLFSRNGSSESGWSMVAGAPQPGTGIYSVIPQIYSADVTQVAFESAYEPSEKSESPEVEYKVGPVGGPYHKAASITHKDANLGNSNGESSGWVAADGDFSKLVLATADHELLGVETGTRSGSDMYEYAGEGGLRQLNVTGNGSNTTTIGSCGAKMVRGEEDDFPAVGPRPEEEGARRASSSHSVSADGSRVLFEAVPGKECGEARHIYMRVDGSSTVDIGVYKFVSADAQDSRLVLKNGKEEVVGYNTETLKEEALPAEQSAEDQELAFVGVPVKFAPSVGDTFAHPRFVYWTPSTGTGGQAFRYDSVEHLVECISCASSGSSAEPKQDAYMGDTLGLPDMNGGLPDFVAASADGDFAFFTTVASLVPQDLDGEIPAEFVGELGVGNGEWVNAGGHVSPSTDVYEWRADGVDGCGMLRGCLALITDGLGGYLNLFLGTADEGRDVFFSSRSVLSPWSHGAEGSIGEGNIYDARIGGGVPPPPARPGECEGDECSTPPTPPGDSTPSSFTFAGVGNLIPETAGGHPAKKKTKKMVKPKKGKKGKRGRKRGRKRGKKKGKGKAGRSRVSKRRVGVSD